MSHLFLEPRTIKFRFVTIYKSTVLLPHLGRYKMIYTKTLHFTYQETDFEAVVTYSDEPFRKSIQNIFSVFWDVKLFKPEVLSCGGKMYQENGMMSLMLFISKAGDRHFIYEPDPNYEEEEDEVNIYSSVINKILYCYFNKERIDFYKKKVKCYHEAIDTKYAVKLEALRQKKLRYRKQMREGKITPKEYQKLYTPVRKEKEALDLEKFIKKDAYEKRYFKCCELKPKYRVFKPEYDPHCIGQQFEWCDTSFVKKIGEIEVK